MKNISREKAARKMVLIYEAVWTHWRPENSNYKCGLQVAAGARLLHPALHGALVFWVHMGSQNPSKGRHWPVTADKTEWHEEKTAIPDADPWFVTNRQIGASQRSAHFFLKGPESKHFRCCRPYSLHCNYAALLPKHENTHRQYLNKWTWPCSNKTLSMDTGI